MLRPFLSRIAMTVLVAATLGACSGEQPGTEDSGLSEASFGLMSVTYDHTAVSDDANADQLLLNTRAQFVRYTAMDRDHVGRLLALPLDPSRDLPQIDQCHTYDLTLDIADDDQDRADTGHVELLEAGQLRIQTDSGTVQLTPRHFATLLPFISGVVYGEAQSTEEQRLGQIKVNSRGGETVGAFSASSAAPALPRLLGVDGSVPRANLAHSRSRDLAISWQPTKSARPGDLTYVELRYTRGKREQALRCRPRDDGQFDIPATLLSSLSGNYTLEIVRLRRSPFTADGLDRGELRVSVRELIALSIQ